MIIVPLLLLLLYAPVSSYSAPVVMIERRD
jgi:hypothetical protein